MGMGVGIHVVNSSVVYAVDTHFTMRMYDMVVFHNNSYMNDIAFIVIKKSKVARLTFFNKT